MKRTLAAMLVAALAVLLIGCDSTESTVDDDVEYGTWDLARSVILTRTATVLSQAPSALTVTDATLTLSGSSVSGVSTASAGTAALAMVVGGETWTYSGTFTRNGNELLALDLAATGSVAEGFVDLTMDLSSSSTMTGTMQYQDGATHTYRGTAIFGK